MDRLECMRTLAAVVEAGSFSAAARKLGAPLPTVSRRVSELEALLRARLLIRSTRRLTLTDAGAAYVAAATRILEQVREAERAAAGEYSAPRGELIVAAPVAFGRLHVLPVIDEFLSRFADIDVRLALSDRNVHLIDDRVDVAARIGSLPDSSTMAMRVGSVRRIVCGSPTYMAAHGRPRKPGDLSQLACVTFDGLGSATAWSFRARRGRAEEPAPIRSRLLVNAAEAAVDAAVAGVGMTRVLSYQAAEALAEGKLEIVLEDFEPDPLPVSLIHPGQALLPLKTRSFLEFSAPRLRERLARTAPPRVRPDDPEGRS
jgi:DNA-binding transcriptional LysR family regulator